MRKVWADLQTATSVSYWIIPSLLEERTVCRRWLNLYLYYRKFIKNCPGYFVLLGNLIVYKPGIQYICRFSWSDAMRRLTLHWRKAPADTWRFRHSLELNVSKGLNMESLLILLHTGEILWFYLYFWEKNWGISRVSCPLRKSFDGALVAQ